jgi:hypothetical protein
LTKYKDFSASQASVELRDEVGRSGAVCSVPAIITALLKRLLYLTNVQTVLPMSKNMFDMMYSPLHETQDRAVVRDNVRGSFDP